ncbi:hypothetical protein [Comamonas sp. JC664]|uniref:hypothetical protein n=1 Tax=Comamonas sp. JC664 TaxID=2801917 RepID=UPI001749A1A3|nr:hypothetical protein [Comamonas sp. JC664]MBL0696186.1 hypothetical protein [Comamonas sp. JC664]GHG65779.1 hypothetical protein GCM10012319_07190 [Comamonas sp. KCTC 72670]
MNLASLIRPQAARPQVPAPRRLRLMRVQATVFVQGSVGAMKDGVKAFRYMCDVLTGSDSHPRS